MEACRPLGCSACARVPPADAAADVRTKRTRQTTAKKNDRTVSACLVLDHHAADPTEQPPTLLRARAAAAAAARPRPLRSMRDVDDCEGGLGKGTAARRACWRPPLSVSSRCEMM
jgi:hypothetical protein